MHAIFVRVFIIVILIYSSVDRKAVVESKCKVGHMFSRLFQPHCI